jgi:hypothetical protein
MPLFAVFSGMDLSPHLQALLHTIHFDVIPYIRQGQFKGILIHDAL